MVCLGIEYRLEINGLDFCFQVQNLKRLKVVILVLKKDLSTLKIMTFLGHFKELSAKCYAQIQRTNIYLHGAEPAKALNW